MLIESYPEYLVIDSFYRNPAAVRELARTAVYAGKGELSRNVPGIESEIPFFSNAVIEKFETILGKRIEIDLSRNAFGRFRLALGTDTRRTRVHSDNTDWTAVVYLTPDEHCQGGTGFFEHKPTRFRSPPTEKELSELGMTRQEFDRDVILADSLIEDRWELTRLCPMRFNRCILLKGAQYYHGSDRLFGDCFENGRLTQNFFFNEVHV